MEYGLVLGKFLTLPLHTLFYCGILVCYITKSAWNILVLYKGTVFLGSNKLLNMLQRLRKLKAFLARPYNARAQSFILYIICNF